MFLKFFLPILFQVTFLPLFIPVQGQNITVDLEENDHVLFCNETPIYLVSSKYGPITYYKTQWGAAVDNLETPRSASSSNENLKNQTHNKNLVNKTQNLPNPHEQKGTYLPTLLSEPLLVENTVPDIVYPEILVVVDYGTYQYLGSNVSAVVRYIAAYYGGVDLRFRQVTEPKIRLNIAAVLIAQDPDSCLIHRYGSEIGVSLFHTISDHIANDYIFFQQQHFDLVNVLIHRDAIIHTTISRISGVAGTATACRVKKGHALAITQDTGSFMDSTTVVHELAHVFGAPHDGPDTQNITGGPCNWEDGFLMSYRRKDENARVFSNCSIKAMQTFLKSPRASCLIQKPLLGKPGKKILPGRVLTRDEQCARSLGKDWISDKSREIHCQLIYCALKGYKNHVVTPFVPPAEGSYCTQNHICLNGNCVRDPYHT